MAQQWRHGWIPLTAAAMREKNHGATPGPNNKIRTMAKGGTSARMDSAIRDAARSKKRNVEPDKPSPSDDVTAATAAIKAGDNAKAVNLLTRAMNNATGKQKAAIKAQRAELSRKLMGR
ncbi:hypothetical protein ACFWYW_55540 [Nonomuraea sp. NPDC059023]|uniref:hypothetical protein n=1 Tax=unclassified Nonomuraea TaxID=2593643 RepID=UPI0036A11B6C